MRTIQKVIASGLAAVALLAGCANPNYRSETSPPYSTKSSRHGVIDSIEKTRAGNDGIGAGAVIGGVVGGALGNQVGSGSGNTAATVAGAVGGAVVGNEIEKRSKAHDAYRVRVRLDNGSYQTVTQDSITDLQVGNRVRVENDRVYRYYDRGY